MAGGAWKIAVLMAVLATFAILESRTVEAQAVTYDCRTGGAQCAANAYCYGYYSTYRCLCRRGYTGDGYAGDGFTGCRRRKLRTWQVVVSIIGSIIGALLILCLCLACIRNCVRRRSRGHLAQQQGDPAYGYPQQQPYPQQGVPMYATDNQKVPGPQGVV